MTIDATDRATGLVETISEIDLPKIVKRLAKILAIRPERVINILRDGQEIVTVGFVYRRSDD